MPDKKNNLWIKKSDIDTLTFQPLEKEGIESFKIWDNKEDKFLFSEKINGKEISKYIKLTDEEKKRYNRSLGYRRTILVDGKTKKIELPVTAEEQLKGRMKTVTKLKKDPLAYDYLLKRTGEGIDTKYTVEIGDYIGKVGKTQSRIEKPYGFIEEKELRKVKVLVDAMIEKELDPYDPEVEKKFKDALIKNEFDMSKIDKIYDKFFKEQVHKD